MPNSSLFLPSTPENESLRREVAPRDWKNPTPARSYNLVVIGGGSAGLVTAAGAAGLGARVALVEKHALGGDCLNVGCVPSKALLAVARQIEGARTLARGKTASLSEPEVGFAAVMDQMRARRAAIAPHDSASRFRDLGVDIFFGAGSFVDDRRIRVGDAILPFRRAVIATGARAALLPIPGLADAGVLTNETLFSLTTLPRRLAIIGAGPIGCEMAQAFVRFGSEVTLLESDCRVLPREDPEAAQVVREALHREGVRSLCAIEINSVRKVGSEREINYSDQGKQETLRVDEVLLGVGRAPNVEGLGLETIGVEFNEKEGIKVDPLLCTSHTRIFAIGDVAMKHKFTHMAGATARLVLQNALFRGKKRYTDLVVPWCTYTEPELAHVGLHREEAVAIYGENRVATFLQPFRSIDRSFLEGRSEGFVKVHALNGRIIGATVVGEHAGELITPLTLAIKKRISLADLSSLIYPYPSRTEILGRLGDAYQRTRFTPLIQKLFHHWLKITR
jgi:pyruvate/2-oxoglutarate dehydrogenase complex dihydrolipoamide dehydrogenase (E3) component